MKSFKIRQISPDEISNIDPRPLYDGLETTVTKATYRPNEGFTAVAIKKIVLQEDYEQEKAIHSSLNHPHILKLLGYIQTDVAFSLVTVLATNGTLQEYLDKNSNDDRTQATCLQYARDIAAAVRYLHSDSVKVLHGNLTPSNILALQDGTLVVADFGCGKKIPANQHSVLCGRYFGTEYYWPPEKAKIPKESGEFTLAYDIYTLAWILYLLTTDNSTDPYANMSDGTVSTDDRVALHKENKKPEIPDTPSTKKLATLIYSCMAGKPEERPTAAQVHEILKEPGIVFRPRGNTCGVQ